MTATRATVCIDLDSTLCDTRQRQHLVRAGEDYELTDWVAYSLACADDAPVPGVCVLVRILAESHQIVILSGRDESARELTETWLAEQKLPYDELILGRRELTAGGLQLFKLDQVRQLIAAGAQVSLVIDDDPDVAEALAGIGVPTLTVRRPGE